MPVRRVLLSRTRGRVGHEPCSHPTREAPPPYRSWGFHPPANGTGFALNTGGPPMPDSQEPGGCPLVRILIVDDNRDAADSLALLLRTWGYGCHVAYDGPSGFASAC